MLDNLYANEPSVSLEKTAEATLLEALQGEGHVTENPYADMSTAELEALESLCEKTASAEDVEATTMEIIGGQVMAHAAVHEAFLMKTAMANGLCRVCKESPLDVAQATLCSSCLGA